MPAAASRLQTVATHAVAWALALAGLPALALDWAPAGVVQGSGRVVRNERQVSAFKRLSLELPASVDIIQGDAEGVTVEADDNIAPLVETVVENEQLKIRTARRFTLFKDTSIRLTVRARSIESLAISGSGVIKAEKLQAGSLATHISGSGDVRIAALDVGALGVSISGNGDFLASGRADSVQYSISGSGNIKTARLAAKNVKLSIAGSGNVQLWASQTLDVNIAGSGNVDYYGDAALTRTVAGSGRIRKLGATPGNDR